MMEKIRLSYPVPYYAQVASPDLAAKFFDEGMDLRLDPRWREFGAADLDEYVYWVNRACGVVCVKMCVEALGGKQCSVVEWARRGLDAGGYLVQEGDDGDRVELGWIHKSLARLITDEGFYALPGPANIAEILLNLRQNRMVIASVSFELGTDKEVTRKGGHLVIISGADFCQNGDGNFYIHNPSGRSETLRKYARIPFDRFSEAFSGRIIRVAGVPF